MWKRRLGIQGSACLSRGGRDGSLNQDWVFVSPSFTCWNLNVKAFEDGSLGEGRASWWNPCIYKKNQHLPPLCVAIKKAATDTLDPAQVPHHTLPAHLWWFATARARNLGVFPSARAQLRAVYISRSYQDTACFLSTASVWPASFLLPQPCLPHHDAFIKPFYIVFVRAFHHGHRKAT